MGKSTILSMVTAARPKIADYHFTTLEPNLGVVKTEYGDSFVIADIPGIIEGASEGVGLGLQFLRHIERTRLLLHVIDVSGAEGRNPVQDFKTINTELKKYSEKLASRTQIIVANKIDSMQDERGYNELEQMAKELNLEIYKKMHMKLSLLIPRILIKSIGKNKEIKTYIFMFRFVKIKFTKKYKIIPIIVSKIVV